MYFSRDAFPFMIMYHTVVENEEFRCLSQIFPAPSGGLWKFPLPITLSLSISYRPGNS